jgi:hypothetical protein
MDFGMALAAGLSNGMLKGADGMAQDRKEQGLLELMLAKQDATRDRQLELLAARQGGVGGGGGTSSGGTRKAGGSGLLEMVDAGILTPEQNKARILGQVGTMDDFNRNTEIINNPQAARERLTQRVPEGHDGPPQMVNDADWRKYEESAFNFMRDINTAIARSGASAKDMGDADVNQSNIEIGRRVASGRMDTGVASDAVSLINGKPLKPVEDTSQLKAGTMTNLLSDITRQQEMAQKAITDANAILKEKVGVDEDVRKQALAQRTEAQSRFNRLEQAREKLLSSPSDTIAPGVSAPETIRPPSPNDPRYAK